MKMANTHFKDMGFTVHSFQSDNGSEYLSTECQELYSSLGINHRTSVPYQPEQNGMAERINRTILVTAQCIRLEAQLPQDYWWLAVTTAAHIINSKEQLYELGHE